MIFDLLLADVSDAVSTASDAAANQGDNGLLMNVLLIGLMLVVMYFILIRPQRKKQKEEVKMRNEITIGDEIVTIGGILGRVVSIKEDTLLIETGADRDKIRVMKWAIQTNMTRQKAAEEAAKEAREARAKAKSKD